MSDVLSDPHADLDDTGEEQDGAVQRREQALSTNTIHEISTQVYSKLRIELERLFDQYTQTNEAKVKIAEFIVENNPYDPQQESAYFGALNTYKQEVAEVIYTAISTMRDTLAQLKI